MDSGKNSLKRLWNVLLFISFFCFCSCFFNHHVSASKKYVKLLTYHESVLNSFSSAGQLSFNLKKTRLLPEGPALASEETDVQTKTSLKIFSSESNFPRIKPLLK